MTDDWQKLRAAAGSALISKDFAAAERSLLAALTLRPDDADSWFNLGYARRHSGDYGGALDAYAAALAHGLSGAEAAHVNRAIILSNHLGQADEAAAALDNALAINPQFLPAWLNLGELMEDQGDAAAARKAYDRALKLAPENGRAQARLAALSILRGDIIGAVTALERRCQRGLARDDDALEILFAYGNALDAAGQFDAAFAAIASANALSATLRRPGQRYDAAQMTQLVDQLCAFTPPPRRTASEPGGERALFICGMFRSGSTVFEQLLTRHPAIVGGGELEQIPGFVHGPLKPYPDRLHGMTDAVLDPLRADYRRALAMVDPASRYVTDKRPDNFLHIGLIKALFPDAKIIVTRRALRDNLLSILFLNFAETITYSDVVANIVHYMQQYARLMAHWTQLYGDDIRFVDYETIVDDPQPTLLALYDWLGLAPPDGTEQAAAPIIRTPSNWQARSALHSKSVDRWRNYEKPLAAHHAVLAGLPQP